MNVFRTGLLLAAMTALFLAIGYAVGGEGGLLIAFLLALGMNAFSYWNSADMVLRMHNARQVDRMSEPDLWNMVHELAKRADLPMPKVYVINESQPNAFATGRSPNHAAVAATTGIMQSLSRDELAGVMAHELAHVKNRDTLTMTVAATIAGAIGFLSQFAFFFGGSRDGNRGNPILMILIMILAPMAAAVVQMAISRTREYSADKLGAQICGHPRWLASALQKIEHFAAGRDMSTAERNPATASMFIINPLHARGMASLFRTHPPTEERIRRLMAMTDVPAQSSVSRSSQTVSRQESTAPRRGGSVPSAGGRSKGPWR